MGELKQTQSYAAGDGSGRRTWIQKAIGVFGGTAAAGLHASSVALWLALGSTAPAATISLVQQNVPAQPGPVAGRGAPSRGRGPAVPPAKSPEVLVDGRVTFCVRAPNAQTVAVAGQDAPSGPGVAGPMAKGADGVWTFTTEPLPPDVYNYLELPPDAGPARDARGCVILI